MVFFGGSCPEVYRSPCSVYSEFRQLTAASVVQWYNCVKETLQLDCLLKRMYGPWAVSSFVHLSCEPALCNVTASSV